jgi:hypothetical protein
MSCIAITTHTTVVKLLYKVVISHMRGLFRKATTCFSFLALSLLHVIKNLTWYCMRRHMEPLTCTSVLAQYHPIKLAGGKISVQGTTWWYPNIATKLVYP